MNKRNLSTTSLPWPEQWHWLQRDADNNPEHLRRRLAFLAQALGANTPDSIKAAAAPATIFLIARWSFPNQSQRRLQTANYVK